MKGLNLRLTNLGMNGFPNSGGFPCFLIISRQKCCVILEINHRIIEGIVYQYILFHFEFNSF